MSLTSVNKLEHNTVELMINVSEEQFQDALNKAYKKKVKSIALPGFRKGKAPKAMIEKMYGKEFFYDDAINMVYPSAYEAAVAEANIEPVDRANVSDLTVEQGKGFSFKATVTVKPDVTVKNYKGIKAEKNIESIMAADVKAELERMRERNARMTTIDSRAAKNGDTAVIDFEGFKEGVAFEGGKGENFPLVLGSGQFIPGFEEQVVGHNTGDEFDVNVTFPEDYHAEDLKGQPVVFKVKLNTIQEKELPALDDEFAKDVSEFDTLDELKKDVKERLQKEADKKAQVDMENSLITTVIENMEGEIPECMFENKINEMVNDFTYRLQSQGMNLDLYLHYTGSTMESFRETFKESAERQVKIRLALEKIAEVENLTATPEDIEAEYEKIAKNYGIDAQKVKGVLPEKEVIKDVTVNKAIDLVRDSADVTEKKIKKTASKSKKKAEGEATEEAASEEE
ncbi:trigger factor [uncultured Negativibacillus sp.]|uniref:trigger factor n=1 Tax=uncultured Negativibacillus sp. TaxID=1980696 RepID=UPI0025FA685A|nr:trigger factor [uncultured Negativibacillus sp.]